MMEGLVEKRPLRPTLGNEMNIAALQARAAMLSISPGTNDLVFFSGKRFGEAYAKSLDKKDEMRKGLDAWAEYMKANKIAVPEVASCDGKACIVRMRECAFSHGMPSLGLLVCQFDAGFLAGFLGVYTGGQYCVRETKCNANGDDYCEFVVREYKAAEAFEEAFGRKG